MKSILVRSMLAIALAGTTGCFADEPGVAYVGEDNGAGDLVEVSPGVEVVADYNEPIFYSDNYYWVNRGGLWYSSTWYGGGWGRASYVPGRVSGISNRDGYAHYRPAGYARHEAIHGGYANHAQYHQSHASAGGYHVRAAVRGGGGGRHR